MAELRPELGYSDPNRTEVLAGLILNEFVITDGNTTDDGGSIRLETDTGSEEEAPTQDAKQQDAELINNASENRHDMGGKSPNRNVDDHRCFAGIWLGFLSTLAVNLMPDLAYPTITIRTEANGYAPEEAMTVSQSIESAVATTPGLSKLDSRPELEV